MEARQTVIRNIVPFGDAVNVPWRLDDTVYNFIHFIQWAAVTAECMA
jgi:hypothetical protein